jgi:hypothetical protein
MASEVGPTVTIEATNKVKLNPPTPFNGKQNKFIIFMQDIYVYLKVNKHIYNDNDKKISFLLSYLTGGMLRYGSSSSFN